MVRVSFRICAWTILLTILRVGRADCLEVRKQHPSIQSDHHLGTGYTESLSTQLKMEVMTVKLTQADATRHSARVAAAERQNRRSERSFSLEGTSSRPTTSMSLNNVTSVIGKLNSTKVPRNFSQIKETCTLPITLMNSSKSPSSENVTTEFMRGLRRGNSVPRDNSSPPPPSAPSVPSTAPSWPKVTLAPSIDSTVSTCTSAFTSISTSISTSTSSSTSTYERDLNELFGVLQSDQRDSSATAPLLADSPTQRSISQDNRGNVSSDQRTLLKLNAPEILPIFDADSIIEQNSPEFTHLRVKRDKLDKLLLNASYPLQEDFHLNSSQLHELPYSFSTSSQSSNHDPELIDNFVLSTVLNNISSSTQPEYRLPVQESRPSFLSISRIIMNERSNSDSREAQNIKLPRNALNDVYPDLVNNLKSPIRMVKFIRKKRQMLVNDNFLGNPSNYREVLEESYPEDDKVIESMLSKVDYNTSGRNSLVPASPLQVQGNWMIGRSEKKRQKPPVNLVSRYKKKAMKYKHNAKNRAQRKEKSWKHAKVHSKGKKYIQGDPNRPMLDQSIIPNAQTALGGLNDYLQVESKIGKRNSSNSAFEMETAKENFKKNFHKRRTYKTDGKNAIIVKQDQSIVVSPHDGRGQRESFEEEEGDEGSSGDERRRRFKRHEDDVRELRYYEAIQEPRAASGALERDGSFAKRRRRSRTGRAAKSVEEIKELVEKLVAKVGELQNYVSNDGESKESRKKVEREKTSESKLKEEPRLLEHSSSKHEVGNGTETSASGKLKFQETRRREEPSNSVERIYKDRASLVAMAAGGRGFRKARRKRKSHRKWDRWTDWSSCSVTCGKGRQIRWRHCIHDCTTAETEMEEKACQLPACAPGKFLGIF